MHSTDVHEYVFRPASLRAYESRVTRAGDLEFPYLVTVLRSDDPSEEPVAELPYPQAREQYGDPLWPAVVTCGTCQSQYPDIMHGPRCPWEYDHPGNEEDDSVPPLYKTTIVIWSRFCGDKEELSSLAAQAEDEEAYCSRYGSVLVSQPAADPDWDGTDFFDPGTSSDDNEEDDDDEADDRAQ